MTDENAESGPSGGTSSATTGRPSEADGASEDSLRALVEANRGAIEDLDVKLDALRDETHEGFQRVMAALDDLPVPVAPDGGEELAESREQLDAASEGLPQRRPGGRTDG